VYCWDGHDNAQRAEETGVGRRLDRNDWTDTELAAAVMGLLSDRKMRARLKKNAQRMAKTPGPEVAAEAILKLL
jgi:UDP:flavonoid glycosyltransferase YjiC (YdhE family)